MGFRLRHCIECPECRTRYLIGFSPYENQSHLVSLRSDRFEEYELVCFCCRPPVCSRWRRDELKMYGVSNRAYARGYGSPDEIWALKLSLDSMGANTHSERKERRRLG